MVVGHGYAGLNACRYLASQGIKVILIESQSEDRYMAMGNEAGTPNAKALLDRGVPTVDPIEYYNNWMLNCNYQANPQLVMKFCQNSGASMDEYLSVLSEEDLAQMTTAFYPPTEHQMDHIGAISDGATFLFSMEAQQLISDGNAITGLVATNADGEYIKFNCKAVVLATGGFGANKEMQED